MKKDKLHNIKKTGYKTPDNYFESFENRFFERLSEGKSVEDIKDSGYTVPKNYFDSVEGNVLNKIHTNETSVVKLKSRQSFYYIAGIAASLVLLIAIFLNNDVPEESLSIEMVETYIENRDLDSYELAQLLSDADLLEDDFTITNTPYQEENLENYLLDNADIETYLE
ncbi:hypothetical protein [Winogradskyella luteola]|uniref:Uncharacterized protein n=1 Tax=Winogradskyella luteola TaxID=2828330 RepID=A0A9X1F733_9FLAO|nr:hypothetical protein [Winogradskyella luteola]MBV7268622.1 hypothetical protein [Winogradskyella luteola]